MRFICDSLKDIPVTLEPDPWGCHVVSQLQEVHTWFCRAKLYAAAKRGAAIVMDGTVFSSGSKMLVQDILGCFLEHQATPLVEWRDFKKLWQSVVMNNQPLKQEGQMREAAKSKVQFGKIKGGKLSQQSSWDADGQEVLSIPMAQEIHSVDLSQKGFIPLYSNKDQTNTGIFISFLRFHQKNG